MDTPAGLLIQKIRDVTIANFEHPSMLDAAQIQAIGEQLYKLVDVKYCKRLVLDFSKVQFMSSSALGVLINLRNKSVAIKGSLVICGLRKDLMKVFEITKLNKLFTFCANEDEALATFGVTTAG
jgi:anti-sigma B factor antagonist